MKAGPLVSQESLPGSKVCPVQDPRCLVLVEQVRIGPAIELIAVLAGERQMVPAQPVDEEEPAGSRRDAALTDADGRHLDKFRGGRIPQGRGLRGAICFPPGSLAAPVLATVVVRPGSACLSRLEQPFAASANAYIVGGIDRAALERLGNNDFYGGSRGVDPPAALAGAATPDQGDDRVVCDLGAGLPQ